MNSPFQSSQSHPETTTNFPFGIQMASAENTLKKITDAKLEPEQVIAKVKQICDGSTYFDS